MIMQDRKTLYKICWEYGDPTGKSEHLTSRFLNDGQKMKIISEMLQKMDWYQDDMEDEE